MRRPSKKLPSSPRGAFFFWNGRRCGPTWPTLRRENDGARGGAPSLHRVDANRFILMRRDPSIGGAGVVLVFILLFMRRRRIALQRMAGGFLVDFDDPGIFFLVELGEPTRATVETGFDLD